MEGGKEFLNHFLPATFHVLAPSQERGAFDRTIRKEVGNYVPAPAVIRRPQALSGFIGRKEHVGGLVRLLLKPTA